MVIAGSRPSKTELRKMLRQRRRALAPREQRDHARALVRHALGLHAIRNARRIGAYWANDGEMDPKPLLRQLLVRRRRLYLPMLRPLGADALWFLPWRADTPLIDNRFGIPEPRVAPGHRLHPWQLDVLLLPLVGFDALGRRLGMGGGYYDRSLAYLRQRQSWRRPLLIGLAHECQRLETLDAEPWDVPLALILTEAGCYRVSSSDISAASA